jgi:Exostosin family.
MPEIGARVALDNGVRVPLFQRSRSCSMTKVFFTLVPCPQAEWEGEPYLNFVLDLFHKQKRPGFTERFFLAQSENSADLIVILEPATFKTKEYAEVLWSMESINQRSARVHTINYDDAPLAYLPGIYAAMPRPRFESDFTIAGGYLVNSPNAFLREAVAASPLEPQHLFTFRGALSSPLRRRMSRDWSAVSGGQPDARFTVVDAWFNHTDEQKRDYVRDILDSKFVLCPRGQGTASHRLFEVMQLGRVPVIIADDWVEPPGPAWNEFSLRVPELAINSVSKLLTERESDFPQMAEKAREAWENFFAPEARLSWILEQLEDLRTRRSNMTTDFRSRWSQRSFYRGNLGSIWDRLGKRLHLLS